MDAFGGLGACFWGLFNRFAHSAGPKPGPSKGSRAGWLDGSRAERLKGSRAKWDQKRGPRAPRSSPRSTKSRHQRGGAGGAIESRAQNHSQNQRKIWGFRNLIDRRGTFWHLSPGGAQNPKSSIGATRARAHAQFEGAHAHLRSTCRGHTTGLRGPLGRP